MSRVSRERFIAVQRRAIALHAAADCGHLADEDADFVRAYVRQSPWDCTDAEADRIDEIFKLTFSE